MFFALFLYNESVMISSLITCNVKFTLNIKSVVLKICYGMIYPLSRCTHEEDTGTRRRGGKLKYIVFNGDIKAGQDKARLTWTETLGSNE